MSYCLFPYCRHPDMLAGRYSLRKPRRHDAKYPLTTPLSYQHSPHHFLIVLELDPVWKPQPLATHDN